jgi:malate dehydrogenase (oxaloacetate-decarboxylating)
LCFPGIFRGALDARASCINEEMKLAAAHAIAGAIGPDELHAEHVVPSVFDKRIVKAVAQAVDDVAHRTGVARRGN